MDWKKMLAETLLELGIIKGTFTGKIEINLNQATIADIKRTETLR
jgi:hypothetical protein